MQNRCSESVSYLQIFAWVEYACYSVNAPGTRPVTPVRIRIGPRGGRFFHPNRVSSRESIPIVHGMSAGGLTRARIWHSRPEHTSGEAASEIRQADKVSARLELLCVAMLAQEAGSACT